MRSIFIENLKACRKAKGLSQMKLAELCGTSTSYIGEIEIGKKFPSVEMIQQIAAALCVKPCRLFADAEDLILHPDRTIKRKLIAVLQASIKETIEKEFGLEMYRRRNLF
ncbi:MAG: helix-turn-helix domain-containing protein [Treponema sp.]